MATCNVTQHPLTKLAQIQLTSVCLLLCHFLVDRRPSDLQMNVIAPKKKAGEDVPLEIIGQLKQWKVHIATLIGEVKEWEQKRNEALARIDEL